MGRGARQKIEIMTHKEDVQQISPENVLNIVSKLRTMTAVPWNLKSHREGVILGVACSVEITLAGG